MTDNHVMSHDMSVRVELHPRRQLDAMRGRLANDRYGYILGNRQVARCVLFFLSGRRRTDKYKSQHSNSTAALRLGILHSTSESLFVSGVYICDALCQTCHSVRTTCITYHPSQIHIMTEIITIHILLLTCPRFGGYSPNMNNFSTGVP